MLTSLLFTSYYDVYVAFFHLAVQLAVFLSLLVSADRLLAMGKYAYVKARQRLTGKAPEDYWNFQALPEDTDAYPMVRGWELLAGERCTEWGGTRAAADGGVRPY